MSAHRPKSAALAAYAGGRLSAAGRARLERHLERCAICRRELAAIRAYEGLTRAARETPPPELDFTRLEARLAREARRITGEAAIATRRRPGRLALAAAGLAALYLAWPASGPPQAERAAPAAPPAPVEAPARLTPQVTLAAGRVEAFDAEGAGRALEPGAALEEGERLETGDDDGIVHVRLAEGTGLVLGPGSALTLSRVREGEVMLALERGRVTSRVAALPEGARYGVRAAGHTVAVRGTRFSVARLERGLAVDVAEGQVEVQGGGEALALMAPARWRSEPDRAQGEAALGEVAGEVPTPRLVGAPGAWTLVRLEHPELVRWEVDGTPIASAGPVRLWLEAGEHALRGWDARERLFRAELPVGREPVTLAPEALRPDRAPLRPGHLPEAEIAAVVARGRPQLARCYERALRVHDRVGGQLRLRVTVGRMGEVGRVQVLGADTPELRQCVARYVGRWTFPPPGGPVTFELPLAFSSRL